MKQRMKWLILMVAFLILYAVADSITDSIKDYRVHLGEHPFRDFWHLVKYVEIVGLIGFGMVLEVLRRHGGRWEVWFVWLVAVVVIKLCVWNPLYGMRFLWLALDNSINVPVDFLPVWMLKFFGLHW